MSDQEKFKNILTSDDVVKSINDNLDYLTDIIPEITYMFNFSHNHPHHHLNVWNHTLCALSYSENNLLVRTVLFFHDIGKPFSYQDDINNVRHFRGHPTVSSQMTDIILQRLNYDLTEKIVICFYINEHDSKIELDKIHNSLNIDYYKNLIKIQYADLKAHNPDKQAKRLIKYKEIYNKVYKVEE